MGKATRSIEYYPCTNKNICKSLRTKGYFIFRNSVKDIEAWKDTIQKEDDQIISPEKEVESPDLQINNEQIQESEISSRQREEKLKNISNILRTPSGLTNLIDEPAYKRSGIDLEEVPHSSESEVSRHTLSLGDDNSVQIKPNNSFLHDNVD